MTEESLPVGEVGVGHACVGGCIEPGWVNGLGFLSIGEGAGAYQPPWLSFLCASSSSFLGSVAQIVLSASKQGGDGVGMWKWCVPVLNGTVWPSFTFQKFSRWYRAHWGVVRFSMLGLVGSLMVEV